MKKASDYKVGSNFALLLIGPPKSGKTRIAMSFPKPAVLDCDGNLADVRRLGVDFLFESPGADADGNQVKPDVAWKNCCDFLGEAVKAPLDEVETIVIDGLSIMSNYLIESLTKHSKLMVGTERVMDRQLWQPFRNKMQAFMLEGRASNKKFIVTCHEEIIRDDQSGAVVAYRPMIPGQLKQNLAGLFSDCWRAESQAKGSKCVYSCRFAPRNLMQIGNSLGISEADYDFTNKTPSEIWTKLSGFFS